LAREQFEDRGAGGVNSSYTDADFLRMQLALLKSSVAKPTALRIRVDLLLGHFLVLRGETRRGAELADLAVRELPKEEGATPCWLLMLSISNGKTNKWGKRQYGAVIRNRDPLICSHSALAQYFFYRWHQSGEAPPSFKSRSDWYNTKILVGSDEQKSISFRQQYNDIDNLFREAG